MMHFLQTIQYKSAVTMSEIDSEDTKNTIIMTIENVSDSSGCQRNKLFRFC